MRTPAQNEYFANLKAVLDRWDPIGVADVVSDEYDSYVWPIASLLESGISQDKLARHLDDIVTERMGLPGNSDASYAAAAKLRAVPRPVAGTPAEALAPLIGKMAWEAAAGFGSFVTLEFGEPHLEVLHEPMESSSESEKVRRLMRRRSVKLHGDWHFWIEHAGWRLTTMSGTVRHDVGAWEDWTATIDDLSGQRLSGIDQRGAAGLLLTFDLGSILELWPVEETAGDLWSLYRWEGTILACRPDGILKVA